MFTTISVSLLGLVAGAGFAIGGLALAAPLFKDRLKNDPNNPSKWAFFTEVGPNEAKSVIRGGNFKYFLFNKPGYSPNGDKDPDLSPESYWEISQGKWERPLPKLRLWLPWAWWKYYIFKTTGLRVIGIPPFQTVDTYPLPRYKETRVEIDGKEVMQLALSSTEEEKSDHVRLKPFTWFFVIDGVEVETIPFKISGSAQLEVKNPYLALYNVNSWNVVVNQAIRSIGRAMFLGRFNLSDIIGAVSKDLWSSVPKAGEEILDKLGGEFLNRLEEYKVQVDDGNGKKHLLSLRQVCGIDVLSIDITDMAPELSSDDLHKLQAALFAREKAKAREVEGVGEAKFNQQILDVALKSGEIGRRQLEVEGFVRAAEKGTLDALATALLGTLTKKL